MEDTITAINVAAALIAQFSIGCILFIGAFVLRREQVNAYWQLGGHERSWQEPLADSMPWIVLAFSLITTGAIFFSEPYSSLWKPVFGSFGVLSLRSTQAMLVTFLADIAAVFWLSSLTGGSSSPFTPVFFILPALAIFLREGFGRVALYVVLICVLFTWSTFHEGSKQLSNSSRRLLAYWFVSVSSFVLATIVGYVTRPR